MRIADDLLLDTQMFPARFYVSKFPPPEQLGAVIEKQGGKGPIAPSKIRLTDGLSIILAATFGAPSTKVHERSRKPSMLQKKQRTGKKNRPRYR